MNTQKILLATMLGLLVGTTSVGSVEAADKQSNSLESDGGIEEIIVTAQRREQSIQDVPISITAYSAADLEARNFASLSDLSESTPNLTFNSSVVGQQVRIRGAGSNDVLPYLDPSVGIYVDGVYMPRMHGSDLDLMDVERIEVLRGPQGTLFGRNTIGGAINVTTKKPGDEFRGTAKVTTGSYNRLDAQLDLEGPIVPQELSGRIAAVVRNRDGYGIRRVFGTGEKFGAMGGQDRYSIQANMTWTPREDVNISLKAGLSSADEEGGYLNILETFQTDLVQLINAVSDPDYNDQYEIAPYSTYSTGPSALIEDTWNSTLNITWDLDSTRLLSITSYWKNEWNAGIDYDGSPLVLFEQDISEDYTYFSQEFQLAGQTDRLNWVAGLYYGREDTSLDSDGLLFQPLYDQLGVDLSINLTNSILNWNGAAYTQGTYTLTDKLSMTAGARYSYDNKKLGRQRARLNDPVIFAPYAELEKNWSAWSGRLAFDYRWADDVMGFLSVARGYKGGGFNGLSTTSSDLLPFNPEYLIVYEAGLRSDWFDRRLRFNATVFRSDYEDIQFRELRFVESAGDFLQITSNVAEAQIDGVELELITVPIEGFRISAGLGYLDAKYTKIDPDSLLGITADDKFVDTPEWSLNLSAEYTKPLRGGAQLAGRVDYSHKSEIFLTIVNTPDLVQPDYSIVNARLSYTSPSDRWEAAVFGTNLTDEKVLHIVWDIRAVLNTGGQFARPREWGAVVKYNF